MNTTRKHTQAEYQVVINMNETLTLTFTCETKERADQIDRALQAASTIYVDLNAKLSYKPKAKTQD